MQLKSTIPISVKVKKIIGVNLIFIPLKCYRKLQMHQLLPINFEINYIIFDTIYLGHWYEDSQLHKN